MTFHSYRVEWLAFKIHSDNKAAKAKTKAMKQKAIEQQSAIEAIEKRRKAMA